MYEMISTIQNKANNSNDVDNNRTGCICKLFVYKKLKH